MTAEIKSIVIKLGDREVVLTASEASELYYALQKMFGSAYVPYYPYIPYPGVTPTLPQLPYVSYAICESKP